ncbi:MAG: cyclopropane-fatty-acyl-phospholipid synthase family protein [Deltaproteobacteria bacterium]
MNETAQLTAPVPLAAPPASENGERGRTHGLPFIFWILEQNIWALLSVPTGVALIVAALTHLHWPSMIAAWLAVPLVLVVLPLVYLVYLSYAHDAGSVDWRWAIEWQDEADAKQWFGKKIPMEILYEAYIAGKLDFKSDVYETLLRRNQLFRFCFTWGDIKFYFKEFLTQNVTHSKRSDEADIAHVYNRGNDFYHWFLGDTMVYTTGIFHDPSESLETAQERKLELVCQYVHMQPGDQHLDIGCGWGPLITHAAQHHGTFSTGITLAKEQAEWAMARAARAGVSERVRVIVDDYRNLPAKKFDKITCLEMAEHVGIKNFQKFLLQVRSMLKDDGIFYLQIAGLRRAWQFEDLVWGLFMAKYIFPGADASCPLGFVVSQAERAGFEIHRVENTGTHYGVTIAKWYQNWKRNEAEVVAKYGQRWYRLWLMFLGWSVLIGGQGSSALFMVTMTKNTKNDKSTVGPEEAQSLPFSRQDRWIGKNTIGTQR